MNQATGQFDVCCHRPKNELLQAEPSGLLPSPTVINEEIINLNSDTELLFQNQGPAFNAQSLPLPPSCPSLSSLPPISECGGRESNCWSVGVQDLDCVGSALCCFDGCANVCMGEGNLSSL